MGNANEPLRFAPRDGAHLPHPVRVAGLRAPGAALDAPPLLVERRDADFIAGLYDDLRSDAGRAALAQQAPRRVRARGHAAALPRLHPPLQRVFNLALCELLCDHPGRIEGADPLRAGLPRLDPQKVDSCGLVLRRVLPAPVDGARYEAWVKSGTRVLGWEPIDPAHEDDDPIADRRASAASVGHPLMNVQLPANRLRASALALRRAGQDLPVHEQALPAFIAPPDVCAAAGKTLLFGVVQVASGDRAEAPPQAPGYGQDAAERAQLRAHLQPFLRDGGPLAFPRPGAAFDTAWAQAAGRDAARRAELEALAPLTATVRQLGVEFDAFGSTAEARALRSALDALQVEFDTPRPGGGVSTRREPAGQFYRRAWDVLVAGEPSVAFTMPHRSARVTAAQAEALLAVLCAALDAQYRRLAPARGRFESDRRDLEARYVVRAFVRLKPERPGCPGRLLWSPVSEEFTVAPWYESAGQPPALVEMPDLFDRDVLKALKPNVAFTVSPKLARLLDGDPKKLRDGEGDAGDGLGLAWICSFSIPIITICAFIVLQIFLALLNLVFWWLPFLKICIPFPKKLPPGQ